jgi:hypothetical protein
MTFAALRRGVAAALVAVTFTACLGEQTNPDSTAIPIELTNLETATPSFNWPPVNGGQIINMNRITVARSSDAGDILWQLETPGENALAGPLLYGEAGPTGAVRTGSLAALQTGTEYRVTIRRTDGAGGTGVFRKP